MSDPLRARGVLLLERHGGAAATDRTDRWRATVWWRKIGGKYMVTHEHSSVPFDVTTGKAAFDLKP